MIPVKKKPAGDKPKVVRLLEPGDETANAEFFVSGREAKRKRKEGSGAGVHHNFVSQEDRDARKAELLKERQRLPIFSAKDKLMDMVAKSPVLIVIGETGSGKTTQLPQFLVEAQGARKGCVVCTQPRRVAAMTVARRVAEESGCRLGQEVGYAIRFEDHTSPRTRLKYVTDGLLLREAISDPLLRSYSAVIVDEAHERTVQTDVLLGLLKKVAAQRGPSFKLIVMSATLDAQKFSDYFGGAPIAYVQGRQFPVDVFYTDAPEDDYVDAALNTALQLHVQEPEGDILVFLTGQDEIEDMERLLTERVRALPREATERELLVTPIFAALPPELQMKAFDPAPPNTRKVILATNIAETSVTINGVRYVIDTGVVKARAYNAQAGFDALEVVPVSQAQARQRSGRAGREAAGKAFRLYTEASFLQLKKTTPPEILRSNLASVVLQLKALGIDDVLGFDFLDAPDKLATLRALELLLTLGALDEATGRLTEDVGKKLGRLPVDPMFAKVLLASAELRCGEEAIAVVAMASTDAIFFNPRGKQKQADDARRRFLAPAEGDHVTHLAIFRAFAALPPAERGAFCSDFFINPRAMRKALEITEQLRRHLQELGLPIASCGDDLAALRKAIAAGLFPNAARRQPDGQHRVLATGQLVAIHPSSVSHGRRPEAVVFSELVKTTRQYARQITVIDAAWLPEVAPRFFAAQAVVPVGAPTSGDQDQGRSREGGPGGAGAGVGVNGNGVRRPAMRINI